MVRFIITILANGIGLYAAVRLIDNFSFSGSFLQLGIAALVLTLLNFIIRPLVGFITGPVIFLTFGLFWIVISMTMLFLLDILIPSLIIGTLPALLWGTLIVGFINLILTPYKK